MKLEIGDTIRTYMDSWSCVIKDINIGNSTSFINANGNEVIKPAELLVDVYNHKGVLTETVWEESVEDLEKRISEGMTTLIKSNGEIYKPFDGFKPRVKHDLIRELTKLDK